MKVIKKSKKVKVVQLTDINPCESNSLEHDSSLPFITPNPTPIRQPIVSMTNRFIVKHKSVNLRSRMSSRKDSRMSETVTHDPSSF